MRETERFEIRLLVKSDIPAAMQLKELARWNQTEDDWRRLLQLEPRGCFAATLNGNLVGTTTTTTYDGELAWIGMVLVNPENRRRGIATTLMKTALDYLSRNVPIVKLDATDEGKVVYESFGFEVESVIERWSGIAPDLSVEHMYGVETAADFDTETRDELLALDRRVSGVDRSRLISLLIDNACAAPVISREQDGRLSGYALARRGTNADYIGPLVTTDVEQAAPLLDQVLAQLSGRPVYVDLNSDFEMGAKVLADRGMVKQRDLIRMCYGQRSNPTSRSIFAIAGPEVG
jgi:GNAT superfamily N-acetyltransferase